MIALIRLPEKNVLTQNQIQTNNLNGDIQYKQFIDDE